VEPFIGELRLMSFAIAPRGWAFCDGQLLPISPNQPLFSLLGTSFGGDGRTTFALPDLRGRTPMHRRLAGEPRHGDRQGREQHALAHAEMPVHSHAAAASAADANTPLPQGSVLGAFNNGYASATDLVALAPGTVASAGSGTPHENRSPYLTLNWCIAVQGIFPSTGS